MTPDQSARERAKVEALVWAAFHAADSAVDAALSMEQQVHERAVEAEKIVDSLLAYAAERVREENEACARLIEEQKYMTASGARASLAAAIRARREGRG